VAAVHPAGEHWLDRRARIASDPDRARRQRRLAAEERDLGAILKIVAIRDEGDAFAPAERLQCLPYPGRRRLHHGCALS